MPVHDADELRDWPRRAASPDANVRRATAADQACPPPVLLQLAGDADPSVRQEVAYNPAAPVKAALLLALDTEGNVRAALAARAATLVPKLARNGIAHAQALTMHMLEILAIDQSLQVRQALASSLKDVAMVPVALVRKLAADAVREVAEPILRCCLALSDDDLVSLIAAHHESWARQAIAARPHVSERVADALIETGDATAISTLLDNHGALVCESALEKLVDMSAEDKFLQMPLAQSPRLPPRLATRMAAFVEESVLIFLRQRRDFDPATVADIIAVVRRRLAWASTARPGENGSERARRLFLGGELAESHISDALSWSELDFVTNGVALLANVPEKTVGDIFASQSPRSVTALAWRAGLSMRCALQLQARAANVPSNQLLNARGGTEYPLTETAMIWHLEMFGIES